MKKYLIFIALFLPVFCIAQTNIYNYQEKGDTAYVNGKRLIPGDTLHLGCGSNADKSFNYIWEKPRGKMNGADDKFIYLPATYCNRFLIYAGRVDEGFGMMKLYYPVFYDPIDKKVQYNVLFLRAIETKEIRGFK